MGRTASSVVWDVLSIGLNVSGEPSEQKTSVFERAVPGRSVRARAVNASRFLVMSFPLVSFSWVMFDEEPVSIAYGYGSLFLGISAISSPAMEATVDPGSAIRLAI